MIYRGTTPKHFFEFPFKWQDVATLYVSYFQKGSIRVEKDKNNIIYDAVNQIIEIDLTQQETLSFEKYSSLDKAKDSLILIQIRLRLNNGQCWVSEPVKERLGDVIKDGVI